MRFACCLAIAALACAGPTCPAPSARVGNATTFARKDEGSAVVKNVLGSKGMRAFALNGDASQVELSFQEVKDQPFTEALRADVKSASAQPWDLQLHAPNAEAVEKGDVLLATFYFRTERSREESGEGQTEFVFELGKAPYSKSVSFPVRASRAWRQIHVPFVAEQSYAPGEGQINFRLGFIPQTVELGGVTLENFKKNKSLAELPVTEISYPGMEANAAWRAAANQRIDQLRKADLKIIVKDASGRPVSGASVHARLVRQAFEFGTCIPAAVLSDAPNEKMKSVTQELFNIATLENDLKWQPLAGDWGAGYTLERAKRGVAWLRKHGLGVRGHVLVWPGWKNLPRALRSDEHDPERLRAEVKKHIHDLVSAMKGTLSAWDVVNEPFDNHDLLDLLGQEVMVDWFKQARATDPAAKLFINDYAILSGGGGTTPHREAYDHTIQMLVERGAPFDGIGLQGHFGSSLTGPEDLLAILDRFARFKKQIYVTEYDVVLDNEELAARFTRDFYTTLFSHPAVHGILMWGFWDGAHWKKNSPMYRADWSLKPAGQVLRDLLLKEWRTDETRITDATGGLSLRGFLGDYELSASAGSRKKTARVRLAQPTTEVVVTLD